MADRAFDSFAPARVTGSPDADYIDPANARVDLDQVAADAERVRVYAERTRAHRTPDQGIDNSLTFRDLHQAISDIRSIVGKYYALLTLRSVAEWEPVSQYDQIGPFSRAWVTDPAAVARAAEEEPVD